MNMVNYFVPLHLYNAVYYNVLLLLILAYCGIGISGNIVSKQGMSISSALAWLYILFYIFMIGMRPISGVFGDMGMYNHLFGIAKESVTYAFVSDVGFDAYLGFLSQTVSAYHFFLISSILYVYPLIIISKKFFKQYWGYSFIFLIASFSFFSYATNGIRNGLGTSIFLWAIAYSDKRFLCWFLMALSVSFHKSLLLPVGGYVLFLFFKKPQWYFYGWLACIPLSLAAGGFWESLFSGLVADNRVNYLTQGNVNNDNFSSTGFRWDFLIYSAAPVVASYYYIFKKRYKDDTYEMLVSIYLTSNAFWILVIRANFSNRFAYLSWFLMALIIIYPLLKVDLVKNQQQKIGSILLVYFFFTYFMNYLVTVF